MVPKKGKTRNPIFKFFSHFFSHKNLGGIRSRMAKKRRYKRKEG
jgi:hypothetical protein